MNFATWDAKEGSKVRGKHREGFDEAFYFSFSLGQNGASRGQRLPVVFSYDWFSMKDSSDVYLHAPTTVIG